MCGITGTINKNDGGKTALSMGRTIRHRGPDEGPVVVSKDNVSSCAVRLAIVDVSHGTQPMQDKHGDVVAQNGEIYNHEELRADLAKEGYVFETNCDTEILLAGFSTYGPDFVTKLDGIYAISYYDAPTKKLYLFRDYFGVKPLYYVTDGESLEYSSEMKAFWHSGKSFDIDIDFLVFNKVLNWSNPKLSLYKGIVPVLPGSYVEIGEDLVVKQFAYTPDLEQKPAKDFAEATQQTKANLTAAVESQIPKEVEWGVLLSGGVDSSILAWLAKKFDPSVRTYSICSKEMDSEDIVNAREVAALLGTNHTEIRVDSDEAIEKYADYLYSIEDINSRFFFYYFISQFLSRKIKVALCGEGSDELYMGYPVYRNLDQFIEEASDRWSKVKNIAGPVKTEIDEILAMLKTKKESGLYELMIRSQLPWFQLNPVDKCSMRFGVELRVPYLSVQHALPVLKYRLSDKLGGDIEKNILRTAFKDTGLPTISRKKYFAGTRTLPSFYSALDTLAEEGFPRLKELYPNESEILDAKELYALSLLDSEMRKNTVRPQRKHRNNHARVN